MSKTTITLRLVVGIGLLLFAGGVGYLHRSPWSLPFLAAGFTAAYIGGKARVWLSSFEEAPARTLLSLLPVTFLAQTVLVGILYFGGFGVGALVRGGIDVRAWSSQDAVVPIVVGLVAAALGVVVRRMEREVGVADLMREWNLEDGADDEGADPGEALIVLVDVQVTPATFFSGIHFSHGTYRSEARGGGFDGTPNERSAGSELLVAAAEARLGVALPPGLKALYRVQNGGGVHSICSPLVADAEVRRIEHIDTPFGGYSELRPTEELRTIFDAVSDYTDPDELDSADAFPPGCRKMVVLSQWYREMLFLDYRRGGAPRVGYFDLDDDWDEEAVRWWPDFETFFAGLRRYETV